MCVVVVKPFLSLCFAFIFVRAILCLKLNFPTAFECGLKYQMKPLFVAVPVPPAITPNPGSMNCLL